MPFFYITPVIRTMMVKVTCPACGKVQVRERRAEGASYLCQRCGKEFVGQQVLPLPDEENYQD